MSEPGQSKPTSASLTERQREDQAERVAIIENGGGKRRRRGRKRVVFGSVSLVLLLVLVLLPQIAGTFGKGIIESKASEALGADVRIERLGLSWLGSQKVSSLRLVDGSLREAADVDVRVERSLVGLVTNWKDLGRIVVSGSVTLDRTEGPLADLMQDEADPAEPSSGAARLPNGLKAELVFDGLDVRYIDGDGRDVRASALAGTAAFAVGGAITVDLDAKVSDAGSVESDLTIDAEVRGLTDAAGVITPKSATASGTIRVKGASSPIAWLTEQELGIDSTEFVVEVEGTSDRGLLRVMHESEDVNLDLAATYKIADGAYRVEVERGGSAGFSDAVLGAILPEYGELAGTVVVLESGEEVSLAALPGVRVSVSELGIDVPLDGALDLNTLVARITVETDELVGGLGARDWLVEPTTLEFSTRGVERGVVAQAVTSAQIAGDPAGIFVLNAEAADLFGESGELPTGVDEILERLITGLDGVVEINNVETVLAEPIFGPAVRKAGFVLEEDLGETVDMEFSLAGSEQKSARFWLTSDNLRASAGFVLEDGVLRSDDVRIKAVSLAPLMTRQIDAGNAWFDDGGEAELWVRDLVVDLNRLDRDEGVDLRAVSGVVEFRLTEMAGEIIDLGETKPLSSTPAAVTVDLSDVGSGASIAAGVAVRVGDRPAGDLNLSVRVRDLVDERGMLAEGLPTLDGEITVRDVMTSMLQPLVEDAGLALGQDIGPSLTLIAQASVDAEDVVRLEGSAKAERLDGSADFEIRDRVLRSVDDGLRVELRNAGEVIARLLGDGVSAPRGGGVRLDSDDLVIASGADGIDWSRSRVSASVGVIGVTLIDPSNLQYNFERLDIDTTFGAQSDGVLSLNGVIQRGGEPVLMAGQLTLHELINESSISGDTIRLGGQIDVTGFPIAAATDVVDMGGSDAQTIAAELVGRLIDASLVADETTGEIDLEIRGDRLTGSVETTLVGGDLRIESGRFRSVVSEEVIEQISIRAAQAAGSTEPSGLQFTEPAIAELTFGSFGVLSGWSFDPSGTADIGFSASGQVTGFDLRRGDEVVQSGSLGLGSLTIEGRVPVGGVLGDEIAEASIAVSGELVSGESLLGRVVGGLDVSFDAGMPSGPVRGDLVVEKIDSGLVDEVLLLDGFVAGMTGASAGAEISFAGTLNDAMLVGFDGTVAFSSPRLSTKEPANVVLDETSIRLVEPVRIDWQVETDIATHRIFMQPVGAERVLAAEAVDTVITISEFVLARSDGPLRPGLFNIDASYEAPTFTAHVVHEEGRAESGIDHTYIDNRFTIAGDAELLRISGVANPADGRSEPVVLDVTLQNFASETGEISWANAEIDFDLSVKEAPTALYDALLRQGGMMAEVLGPEMTIQINGETLTQDSGVLMLDLDATRASGDLIGRMFEGRFIATEPAQLVVDVVRPELGSYLSMAIPVIGTISKAPEDGPATLTLQTLEVPMVRESATSRLQGLSLEAVIDLGLARFETSSLFVGVVKAAQQRTEGGLGRRMEPIEITVNSGNVTYPRTKVPIGEFTIESEGRYNLVTGDMDIVTYIPFAALSEEALGKLKTGLTSALGRFVPVFESATMVPWRTKGLPGERKTQPDVELLLENVGTQLNPLRILRDEIGIPEFRFQENRRRANDEDESEGG
ncbi:MAG: hypothetical protein ED559_01000 [Phycisphaera sp.]|nr:MAG: hypothetical protein ED559_01000 [Phycisphaera sp.]